MSEKTLSESLRAIAALARDLNTTAAVDVRTRLDSLALRVEPIEGEAALDPGFLSVVRLELLAVVDRVMDAALGGAQPAAVFTSIRERVNTLLASLPNRRDPTLAFGESVLAEMAARGAASPEAAGFGRAALGMSDAPADLGREPTDAERREASFRAKMRART